MSFHERLGGGYWVRRPMPQLDHEYWGTVVDPSGVERNLLSAHEDAIQRDDMVEEVAYLIDAPSVLDLGCGTGVAMAELVSQKPRRVVGIDPDRRALDVARARGAGLALAHLEDLEYGFGGLLCHHTVEHMSDPLKTLHAAVSLCVPGARVVISTPDFNSPSAQASGDRYRLLHDRTHVSLFSTDSLVRMMSLLGLAVVRVSHPFYGTRWEREAREWNPEGKEWSPPAPGNIVSVYAVKR